MDKKNRILYNKFSREYLAKQLAQEDFERTTISFYKYIIIENPASLRKDLFLTKQDSQL